MTTIAVIQARTGSTRLPGKVMYPLAGDPVLTHVVRRVDVAETVDRTVVATSTEPQDDVINATAKQAGVDVVRGSETDVLGRFKRAADQYDPDVLVRVSADCPLVSSVVIDKVTKRQHSTGVEYSSNVVERTFPRGLEVEAFTADSFEQIHEAATSPHHREHVTPYYRERDDLFNYSSVTSREVFDEPWLHDRTKLRLTLDEPADYELLHRVYEQIPFDSLLDIRDAVQYIDENELHELNENVDQKSI